MNKQKLVSQFKKIGIEVKSYEFGDLGYTLKLRLDTSKGMGWEELDHTPIEEVEVIKVRQISEYTREVVLLPNTSKEFNAWLLKCYMTYGVNSQLAFKHLENIIEQYGSITAKTNFASYKSKRKIGGQFGES